MAECVLRFRFSAWKIVGFALMFQFWKDFRFHIPPLLPARLAIAFAFFLGILSLGVLVLSSNHAHAQSGTQASVLLLKDSQARYNLAPYLYVTREDSGGMAPKTLVDRHFSGYRGDSIGRDILSFGLSPGPRWIVFEVYNQSATTDWVLSFGDYMEGRVGSLDKLVVWNYTAGLKYADTTQTPQNAHGKNLPPEISMTLPRGQRTTFVVYLSPQEGMPSTIPMFLMTRDSYMKSALNPLSPYNLAMLLFMGMSGFFIATIFLRKFWGGLAFALYYGLHIFLLYYHGETLSPLATNGKNVEGLAFMAITIAGILSSRGMLSASAVQPLQDILTLALAGALALIGLMAAFVIPAQATFLPALLYLPATLSHLFLILLSIARAREGQRGAYMLAAGWAVMLAATATTFISALGVVMASPWALTAYWQGLFLQAVLFMLTGVLRLHQAEREYTFKRKTVEEETQAVSSIKQSKEGAENARLLRLLEHERAVMSELREREFLQNEEMRKAKTAADQANVAKSAFLAVVSHEIRTPMTGVLGMIHLLLDTQLAPKQKEYAQNILDSGNAMISLLNDILDFEKIENNKLDLESIDFDLHRVLNGIVMLMSGHANNKKIALKLNLDPNVPRYVVGDPVRLRQVLLNLTGNAIKFTSQGSVTIHIKLEPSAENLSKGVSRLYFAVEDTGVGISREAQKSLFTPFSQADSTVSRKFGGTGLGLAISQRLIAAMGGKIQIDSKENKGSTFHFTLIMKNGDAKTAEEIAHGKSAAPAKTAQALRVLIVEDNEISRKLLKEFVESMGHKTAQAVSGEDAVDILKNQDFDLVLMDVQLPGISGITVTKTLRGLPDKKKASTPVIALTGNTSSEHVRECYAANMNGHIGKPIDPVRLKDGIQKVIDNKLDNPVNIESRKDDHVKITQINTVAAPGKKSDSFSFEDGSSLQTASLKKKDTAKTPETQSNSALEVEWRNDDSAIEFSLEDLDEDTFATAVQKGEKTNGAPDAPVFKEDMLHSLTKTMARNDIKALLDDLLDKSNELTQNLSAAIAANDQQTVMARAHELKGMTANFGLMEISALAAKAEAVGKTGKHADAQPIASTRLPEAITRAQKALDQWIESLPAGK